MKHAVLVPALMLLLTLARAAPAHATKPSHARVQPSPAADSASVEHSVLEFAAPPDSGGHLASSDSREMEPDAWLRTPFGDHLLTDPEEWRARIGRRYRAIPLLDYNRVDPLRVGLSLEAQSSETLAPRLGARIAYAFGRDRVLYGAQIEQPLAPPGNVAVGVSMVRRTDHSDLQQVDDLENTLALLFGRQDYRDYFEREGFGVYLAWRVPDFSTVSVHLRNDDYRSLAVYRGTRSLLQGRRDLRDNPRVDEGQIHSATVRLERLAHRTHRTRAGLYHWIEMEWAGRGLGGERTYTRVLADMRTVLRLTPATTLVVRGVVGHTPAGVLPFQKQFTAGGVDGLRAHEFAQFRGNELALAQAEYVIGLWRLRAEGLEGGLHAIAFVDAGRAWANPDHGWDVDRQQIAADGGFGLGTSEDNLRVYLAKNLQKPRSNFVVSVRLQRPF